MLTEQTGFPCFIYTSSGFYLLCLQVTLSTKLERRLYVEFRRIWVALLMSLIVILSCDNMGMEVIAMGQQLLCPNCNKLNNAEARFCQQCGMSFQTEYQQPSYQQPVTVQSPPQTKLYNNVGRVFIAVVIVFMLMI